MLPEWRIKFNILMISVKCGARVLNVYGAIKRHSVLLLVPLCATIPIMDELCCRSCNFACACLSSDCSLISFVARQGIFYSRVASPLGRNAHFCCTRYGGRTQDINLFEIIILITGWLATFQRMFCSQQVYYVSSVSLRDGSFTFTSSCLSFGFRPLSLSIAIRKRHFYKNTQLLIMHFVRLLLPSRCQAIMWLTKR